MSSDVPKKPTVHVVDDDHSFRSAIARLLRLADFHVETYATGAEFLLAMIHDLEGCVLMDVQLQPQVSGMDLHQALSQQHRALPVIYLTAHGDIPMTVQAMKAGAVDFLTKPVRREVLLAAVRSALERAAEMRKTHQHLSDCCARWERLTPREREVFQQIVVGKPNKQVAAELGTAERTVKAHRARVMEKMRAQSLAELVHLADEMSAGGAWPK